MLCQFLLYNKVNQLYVYIYTHISSLLRLSPTLPIHPSRWSQSTELNSPCDAAASHQLFILHLVVYICQYANTYIHMKSKKKKRKNGSEEPRGRTGIKTQSQRMDLRAWGGGRVSWAEVREQHLLFLYWNVLHSVCVNNT